MDVVKVKGRAFVVVAAAAAALAFGLVAWLLPGTRDADPVSTSPPTPQIAGSNRALAKAEAVRVLASIPVPPRASQVETSPVRTLDRLGVYAQEVDASLTQTAWYVVPMGYRELVEWYAAHSPAETSGAYPPDSTTPATDGDLYWQPADASEAFSEPAAVVSYARLGPTRTALRTDATLAARFERTAETLLPAAVDKIEITRSGLGEPDVRPITRPVTDRTTAADIAQTFNSLDGGVARAQSHPCGSPDGAPVDYAVTFRWPSHALTLDVDLRSQLCGDGMRLHLDGRELHPRLAYDGTFDTVLGAAFDES